MKITLKFLVLALIAVMVISLIGCSSEQKEERYMLDCVIEKIYDKTLYVRTESEQYFFVSTANRDTDGFSIGDEIEVVFDGVVKGTSPAEIATVYDIVLKTAANSVH